MSSSIDHHPDLPSSASQLHPITIADAQSLVAGWCDLSSSRAGKMRTALATAARALARHADPHQAAQSVRLDCPSLSRLLQVSASSFGLSNSRRISLCSELRYILRRLDLHEPSTRGRSPTSPPLQALLNALPSYRQMGMVEFLRFVDDRGIALEAINNNVLAAYQTHCVERTLCSNPAERVRRIASNWEWAQKHIADWPGARLKLPSRSKRYSFPFESYPVAFQQDIKLYTERLSGQDIAHIFSKAITEEVRPQRRAQRPLKLSSINGRLWFLRCAAAALVSKDVSKSQIVSLRDLVDPPDRPEKILRFFLERQSNQPNAMAGKVAITLYLVARDYCLLPAGQVAQLRDWANRVTGPKQSGLTEKNTRRLRALMQLRVRAMLLCFPRELMRRATAPELPPQAAARLAMYATAMEIVLICPMRRGNLFGLRLDTHLYQPDPQRQHYTHILINADEVKNQVPISWPIPPESQKLLETYLKRYRSHLVAPENQYLFGSGRDQRDAQFMGEWLSRAVTEAIGVEFNIHLARHFAAWNFLRMNPGQYEVVRQVLGHRSIQTTIKHYVGLEADSAAEHFDRTVLRDRQTLRPVAAYAFRKRAGGLASNGKTRAGR